MLATLPGLPTSPPSLYIDLEGAKLSREGTISLLTLFILPHNTTYLIDIHNLGSTSFTTSAQKTAEGATSPPTEPAENETSTLQSVLGSPSIPKVFFDVRNDSDALFAHYGIKLQCIHDVQLMELATTRRNQRYLSGLSNCIRHDSGISLHDIQHAQMIKNRGVKLFAEEHGGSYEVFNERPLDPKIQEYCVQDVVHMPKLWSVYQARMNLFWTVMVKEASEARVRESQSPGYRPMGEHKKYGCWSGPQIAIAQRRWRDGRRSGLCALK